MTRVVHLHIGAPKTGTTYLQDRLRLNMASLAAQGITIPSQNRFMDVDRFHFRAALDLLDQDWGGAPGHAVGSWDTLVKRIKRGEDRAIISHEILAPAPPDRIARAMNDLSDCEVHIVYSARDLGRQIPAAYQESIKQGKRWRYRRFLNRAMDDGDVFFRRAFDLPTVLNNWSARLPPEQVHVVTVPQHRGPQGDELWQRFCRALSIDPQWAPRDSERQNQSLGVPETQLLRRLNRKLTDDTLGEVGYHHVVREFLAEQVLVDRDSPRLRLPHDRMGWAEEQAQLWIDWLVGSGVEVIGDVEDLRPVRYDPELYVDPDRRTPRRQLDAAVTALAALTENAVTARGQHTIGRKMRTTTQRLRGR